MKITCYTVANSRTADGSATKHGKSTVQGTPVRNLEDHDCKPLHGNQVSERSPYKSTSAITMFTMHITEFIVTVK